MDATRKSRLGRYEHRFLIRGPIQVLDGPVDGVPDAAYSHHQVHRRQDYRGGPDQGGTPPWDYRTRTPHSPPPSRGSAHRCWGPMYTAVLVASPPPDRAPSGPATGVPHWLFIVEVERDVDACSPRRCVHSGWGRSPLRANPGAL